MIKTKKELKEKDIKPVKHLGQNFLINKEIIEKIISAAQIKAGETILEVGPGTGNLTEGLLGVGAEVTAIEKDKNLASLLKLKIKKQKLKIIEGDILKFNETAIKNPYRVIANIPYYLTGALIQKFLLSKNLPKELMLMIQKEVGERITARPPKANFLSSLTQFLAESEILFKVGKENFWPQPKVDSVLIKLTPFSYLNKSLRSFDFIKIEKEKREEFIKFLRVVFRQPRQTLFNNLRKSGTIPPDRLGTVFSQLEFNKKIRPQNLDQEKLIKLFSLLAS